MHLSASLPLSAGCGHEEDRRRYPATAEQLLVLLAWLHKTGQVSTQHSSHCCCCFPLCPWQKSHAYGWCREAELSACLVDLQPHEDSITAAIMLSAY